MSIPAVHPLVIAVQEAAHALTESELALQYARQAYDRACSLTCSLYAVMQAHSNACAAEEAYFACQRAYTTAREQLADAQRRAAFGYRW